jgi:uncharacterized protein YecE (DUF72 family)
MTEQAHPIRIGCSGWSYPDWEGVFYPEGMPPGEYLACYAETFPIVEVDSTFYRVPDSRMVKGWRDRTPDDFRFVLKVPQGITHEKRLRDCGREVEGFVGAIEPLRAKTFCALLQMGYFNKGAFGSLGAFLDALDGFLAAWPGRDVPLAVEIRNARWVGPELAAVLRRHGAALTLTAQKWMPSPAQVLERIDPVTGPLAVVRLLGDREAIEQITTTFDKVVIDRTAELDAAARVIQTLAARVPVAVFANNHFAGHAPATAVALWERLGQPHFRPGPT